MLNFHRESWNPVKKHSKALVFFAVSKQIPIVYSADRGRAEIMRRKSKGIFGNSEEQRHEPVADPKVRPLGVLDTIRRKMTNNDNVIFQVKRRGSRIRLQLAVDSVFV